MQGKAGNIVAMALILTALLILLGIGIGSVVMESSKRSKETDRAIAAYYMANSGIESQLYAIRKDRKTLADVASFSSDYPGGSSWLSTTGWINNSAKVIPSLEEETFGFVDLFDPDNISAISGVSRAVISWQPDPVDCGAQIPQLEVAYSEWQFSGGIVWPSDANYTIAPLSASPLTLILDPSKAYRMRLRPFRCNATNISIQLYNGAGTALSYPGDLTLGSEGTYQKTTQKLIVTMPRQDILSGIFSYIVFTEETLCKKVGLAGNCP